MKTRNQKAEKLPFASHFGGAELLVSGFWFLVSGFWFLVSGFWFSVEQPVSE
jgi:hypothetical protein